MKRRDILKLAALSTGVAVSPPFATAFLSGCTPRATPNESSIFSNQELSTLIDVIDTILPRTDSPSASEVGVHNMLEDFIVNVYSTEDSESSRKELKSLLAELGSDFSSMSGSDKESKLLALGKDESESSKIYKQLRQQTISLYFTTEPVITKHLAYLPVPGDYEACIEIDPKTTKAWAL